MIDIHTHILPGLDDGPSDIFKALEMAKIASNDGIKTIIACPHSRNGIYNNWRKDIISACSKFNSELKNNKVDINVLPGAELSLSLEILDDFKKDRLMTLNDSGRYFFLELPQQIILNSVINFIGKFKKLGITPIITHPERNTAIQNNIQILKDLILAGALSQITAGSLTGQFGNNIFKYTQKIIKAKLIHFIASDAHSIKTRPPVLSKAHDKLISLTDKEYTDKIMFELPYALINGEKISGL